MADQAQSLTPDPQALQCGAGTTRRGQGSGQGHLLTGAGLHPALRLGALGGCWMDGSASTGWRVKSVSILLV